MKDAFLFIFGISILILIIGGIIKFYKADADQKKANQEFDKPENQFARQKKDFIRLLSDFTNSKHYPYVVLTSYIQKSKAIEPDIFAPLYSDADNTIEYKLIKEGKCEKFFYERLIKRLNNDFIKLGKSSYERLLP